MLTSLKFLARSDASVIDKLELRVPRRAEYTPEFGKVGIRLTHQAAIAGATLKEKPQYVGAG